MSREDLAKKIDLSYSTVSKYETGVREPDLKTLGEISKALDVSIDYLMGITDTPEPLSIDEKEFLDTITDPDLKRWFINLPLSKEEDLKKLRKMWNIIKNEGE